MFLNCLLLDLTVIDLISIVHMDKIWVESAKKFEMRTSGGRGGSAVISDTPGRGGEGGSKKGKFLRTSFMDGPLLLIMILGCHDTGRGNFSCPVLYYNCIYKALCKGFGKAALSEI